MTNQHRLDFLAAWGQELSETLGDLVGWENISPQDSYEVIMRVFHQEPTPQLLSKISNIEMELLLAGCTSYFENESINSDSLRIAIDRTLARYPAESTAL